MRQPPVLRMIKGVPQVQQVHGDHQRRAVIEQQAVAARQRKERTAKFYRQINRVEQKVC